MKTIKLYPCFEHWLHNSKKQNNTIWLYSDPHFADEEMQYLRKNYIGDDEQIKRINSKVGKYDTIIFLGDIGDTSFIKKIRGYKVLIMGNHDQGASNFQRVIQPKKEYIEKVYNSDTIQNNIYLNTEEQKRSTTDSMCKLMVLLDKTDKNKVDDNHLFDEVYEGTLQISPKILLSHEPVNYEYCFNIHGHDHSNWNTGEQHLNLCAEHINYTPININDIINSGKLKNIPDIHRKTIDNATEKSLKKNKQSQ